jgi:hypothetical protein
MLPLGSICYLQTLEKENFLLDQETKQKVITQLQSEGIEWIALSYSSFSIKAFFKYPIQIFKLIRLCKQKQIEVLHPFAPVAGFLALIIRKVHSSFLIMDSWEPHAESMVETGVWKKNSIAFKLLWNVERNLTSSADVLLAASKKMKEYAKEKWNLIPNRVYHRPACVNLDHFKLDDQKRTELIEL